MKEIIVVEHRVMPARDRGQIHLAKKGFQVRLVAPHLGEALPQPDERTAGVIIMGGPQFVTELDEFPYLRDEIEFAGKVMASGVPLLGICLGGQVIAAQMGARVAYHPEDHVAFGYYPLRPTEAGQALVPDNLYVPAGNKQGFEVPAGATLLAQGEIFPNQAFQVGASTFGFQFHPELTRPILDLWHAVLADNHDRPGGQSRDEQERRYAAHNDALHRWYLGFLDRLFGDAGTTS